MRAHPRMAVACGLSLVLGASMVGCSSSSSSEGGGGAPQDAGSGTGGSSAGGGSSGNDAAPGTGGASSSSGGATAQATGGVNGSGGASGSTGGTLGSAGGASTGGSGGVAGRSGVGGGISGGGGTAVGGATAASNNITIWMAGDSTMAAGPVPCPVGWGTQFKSHFNNRVTVVNSAAAGRSLHTWLYTVLTTKDPNGECSLVRDAAGNPVLQPRWQEMLTGMKAGDYLFIDFGINDGGGGQMTCPRYEGNAQFETTYGMMAQAAKARGAHPIFLTPTSSIKCTGNTAVPTREPFATDAIQAGAQFDVPVIDLQKLTVALFNSSGFCPLPGGATDITATTGGAVGAYFCDDHTHFTTVGATSIAEMVAGAIRAQNLPLAAYLN